MMSPDIGKCVDFSDIGELNDDIAKSNHRYWLTW